jgi:pilus assembly protein CpaB
MNRKLTGIAAALVLALVGTIVLVGYVRSAEARALSGEELVDVMVVTKTIEAGTPAEDIEEHLTLEQVPAKVRADGAVNKLAELEGKVAAVDLLPGEQLVRDRFATSISRSRANVPSGLMEVTVRLDPERALGGQLRPGDRVAVMTSFDPFDVDTSGVTDAGAPKKTPNTTHLILHKVLVTNVQVTDDKETEITEDDKATFGTAPQSNLLVTLAVDAEAAQRIIFTAEHGRLWLSLEPEEAPVSELIVETRATVDR